MEAAKGNKGGDIQGLAFGVSPTVYQMNHNTLSLLMRRETPCSFDNGS